MFFRIVLLILLVFINSFTGAQPPGNVSGFLHIEGKVLNDETQLEGVRISIEEDSLVKERIFSNGNFSFDFDYQKNIRITFAKNNFVSKEIIINTKVPKSEDSYVFEYVLTVHMTELEKSENKELEIVRMEYDKDSKKFDIIRGDKEVRKMVIY